MDTNGHESKKWIEGELVYQIVGCALEVLNELGHGLHEKPYENALTIELSLKRIPFRQQQRFPVRYKGQLVAEFIPDLVVGNVALVDAKVVDRVSDIERGQMLNYLRITGLRVGLLLNFKRPKLEWERIVL
jgi:GxxExxY protein